MERYSASLLKALKRHVKVQAIVHGKGKIYLPFFFARAFFRILFSKADLFHLADAFTTLLVPAIKIFKKKPVVTTVHGLDVTYRLPLYQRIILSCLKMSDKIIAVSECTRQECIKRGIDRDKIEVIPSGLDGESYPALDEIPKDPDMMITVGRQVKRKGVGPFIATKLNELMEDHPRLKFYIIGTGPEKGNIQRAIARSRFKDRIFYLGRVDDDQLFTYYKRAAFFVTPNIPVQGDVEGYGMVILEAIFYKAIILANPIEGIAESLKFTKNWMDLSKNISLDVPYTEENPRILWDDALESYLRVYQQLLTC